MRKLEEARAKLGSAEEAVAKLRRAVSHSGPGCCWPALRPAWRWSGCCWACNEFVGDGVHARQAAGPSRGQQEAGRPSQQTCPLRLIPTAAPPHAPRCPAPTEGGICGRPRAPGGSNGRRREGHAAADQAEAAGACSLLVASPSAGSGAPPWRRRCRCRVGCLSWPHVAARPASRARPPAGLFLSPQPGLPACLVAPLNAPPLFLLPPGVHLTGGEAGERAAAA